MQNILGNKLWIFSNIQKQLQQDDSKKPRGNNAFKRT